MKVSILLPAFKRPELLRLGLSSIYRFKPTYDYEIIVLNDGIMDETENVCKQFENRLNIKYIFTGKRNLTGTIIKRVPGFALNIGIKQSEGDVIILSCPEMFHLNNAIDIIINKLIENPKGMVIPEFIYFDQERLVTNYLLTRTHDELMNPNINYELLVSDSFGYTNAKMPYLLGVYKCELILINGYDEDFVGYACEDSDLINRLTLNGLNHIRTDSRIIHLYHENTNNSKCHWGNASWVYNYNLYISKKNIIKRNEGREWGTL